MTYWSIKEKCYQEDEEWFPIFFVEELDNGLDEIHLKVMESESDADN